MNGNQAVLLGGIALLASATHCVGRFQSGPIIVIWVRIYGGSFGRKVPKNRGSLTVPE